ncbi:methyltransferase domain-containing protein [Pseudoflavonifractor sp. 524-17]|nr:methyltransferase domain-containing protein [Pseudoflavonifractor sp. 524-17]
MAPYPGAEILTGTAEATGLPDHSADHVTAAQSFHWFDPDGFQRECRRILRLSGKVFLLWNVRQEEHPFTT